MSNLSTENQFADANGDRQKNRYEVGVVTESGCDAKAGEFTVFISRILLGDVGADDWELVRSCVWEAVDEIELPEEGVTGLVLQETGEVDGWPHWHKFYEIAEKNVDIFRHE